MKISVHESLAKQFKDGEVEKVQSFAERFVQQHCVNAQEHINRLLLIDNPGEKETKLIVFGYKEGLISTLNFGFEVSRNWYKSVIAHELFHLKDRFSPEFEFNFRLDLMWGSKKHQLLNLIWDQYIERRLNELTQIDSLQVLRGKTNDPRTANRENFLGHFQGDDSEPLGTFHQIWDPTNTFTHEDLYSKAERILEYYRWKQSACKREG